jgi:hypothetical protein
MATDCQLGYRSVPSLTETLISSTADGYSYAQTGFPGMTAYQGAFAVRTVGTQASLSWLCTFQATTPDVMLRCYALLGGAADQIGTLLAAHFSPRS